MATAPILATQTSVTRVARRRRATSAEFQKLAEGCERLVYQAALRVTSDPSDAEDVRQQTLLKAYVHLSDFDPAVTGERARFHSWVCRVAINEAIDTLRKRRVPRNGRKIELDEAHKNANGSETVRELPATTENPEQLCARMELRRILANAIEDLEPTSRAVCLLRDVENLSTEETAKYLGISVAAVRIRLFRARGKLRERLGHLFPTHASRRGISAPACGGLPSLACGD
jgi:RNA polymerase sigma-70 factor (ECF subfamily)